MSKDSKASEKIKSNPLTPIRHSAEHVLHMAMQELYPDLKKAMGPATDEGFYFDFDLDQKITPETFPAIEARMQEIINLNLPIRRKEITFDEAEKVFRNNPYKIDWLEGIKSRDEIITLYEIGTANETHFDQDLCSGPHAKSTGEIKAFKLLSVAGAYWHGDEKNKMLTRIYGTAFLDKKSLEDYLNKMEEMKKRDHRVIGKALELFMMSEEVGPGLPLWLPNGTVIKEELEKWGKETEDKWGYQRVSTPFLTKKALFEISGHVPYFQDEMYKVSVPGDEKEEYFVKPMNCPFHHMIYKSKSRSYKDLPFRLAEYGTVARYEDRGCLNGILRPRLFVQNDAHVYCSEDQAVDVFVEIVKLHKYYYDILGLKDYYIVLGLRDPHKKNKYHGDEEMWKKAEKLSREAMEKAGIEYKVENEGAAHYGPKMDLKIKSVIGEEYGISTNQIDLFMPIKFNLTYVDKDGTEKFVIVQHRAPLGSSERFIGFLTEHFAGNFPLWLSPLQVKIIPIGEKHVEYAKNIYKELKDKNIRVEVDSRNDTMQSKIRDAQMFKVPYMLIVGDREAQSDCVSLRLRTGENIGSIPKDEFIAKVEQMYLTKSLMLW